ncbi:high-affinity methionine permease [Apiospora rasikravindrae]|uniref:High-affinity methionine permease n=1 Tax=Apiospora rasikravindrae TaxID=990691 RepID=A0ABR1TBK5_9PEZI
MSLLDSVAEKKTGSEVVDDKAVPTSTTGSLQYVPEAGGNDAPSPYQITTGAPVEDHSPLGYNVGPITIIFLNISMMIGTGVYSTPSSVLSGTGSVGLSMIWWFLGGIISLSSAAVYLEFTSYFPSRSGAEVVYLEQAFPYPRFFFPTTYAMQKVIMSFRSSNCIVLANYLFATAGRTGTEWQIKGVALAGYTVVLLAVVFHTKYSYYLSNAIGAVKLITLIFIAITGLVVLGGHSRVPEPKANFANSFEGAATPYGITIALYRIIYSYGGWNNAFNVTNEIKNPVAQIKRNGTISIVAVMLLYILANVAYVAAVGKENLQNSGTIAATLFFTAVFGKSRAVQGLNFLIALSSFGNLLAVMLGAARMLRECGRQGVLPWTRFWVSTKPFNTPLGPYLVDWGLTAIVILALPAGDAFNFVADLAVYPAAAFSFMAAVGLYIVRWRRRKAGLSRSQFQTWHTVIIFNILVHLYLLVMPWYPPSEGKADVSFWYGTYIVTGLAILAACGAYYGVWVHAIPHWRGYKLRQQVVDFGNGAQAYKVVKVPAADVAEWDATHEPGK